MKKSIKNRIATLSVMAFLLCFTISLEAQVSTRAINEENVSQRTDVCKKGEAHIYKANKGKRALAKKRVKPAGKKRYVCATANHSAAKASKIAKRRSALKAKQNRLKAKRIQLRKKSIQANPAKQ